MDKKRSSISLKIAKSFVEAYSGEDLKSINSEDELTKSIENISVKKLKAAELHETSLEEQKLTERKLSL
jgi:hypothetical protein